MLRVAIVTSGERRPQQAAGATETIQRLPQFETAGESCDAAISLGLTPNAIGELLSSGKHVLLVDPSFSIRELDRLDAQARSRNVRLVIGRTRRGLPYETTVRESLDAGRLGKPGLLRIHHWRADAGEGIDRMSLGINEMDIACWLFNAAPELIYARSPAARVMQWHAGFPCGGMAIINCNRALPASAEPYYAMTLIGSNGAAYADDHHNTNLLLGDELRGLRMDLGKACWDGMLLEFASSLESETNDVDGDPSVREAKRAALAMQAVIDSVDAGRVSKLVGESYELQ